jgi:hypothetical protein
MRERTAARAGLVKGIPAGLDRDRVYLFSGAGVFTPGNLIAYHQGSGDGRGADRLGYWHVYRHHGIVEASGRAEVYDAELSRLRGADVWEPVAWVLIRPAVEADLFPALAAARG